MLRGFPKRAGLFVVCMLMTSVAARSSQIDGGPVAVPTSTISPTDATAATVKTSIQQKFDSDPDLSKLDLKVVDVMLVKKAGNEYKGIATVKTALGSTHDVPVDVTADGTNVLWETAPGAFAFAIQEALQPDPLERLHRRPHRRLGRWRHLVEAWCVHHHQVGQNELPANA